MKEHYHHGNLKHDLIEIAIQTISEEGPERLSLRNVSKQCGVSHNAIYRHFNSKDELIWACQDYITEILTEFLTESIDGMDVCAPATSKALSYAYIDFFRQHPTYYRCLYYSKSPQKIVFTLDETADNYPPYELFRKLAVTLADRYNITREAALKKLVKNWAVMEGITSMIISPVFQLNGDWTAYLDNIFD